MGYKMVVHQNREIDLNASLINMVATTIHRGLPSSSEKVIFNSGSPFCSTITHATGKVSGSKASCELIYPCCLFAVMTSELELRFRDFSTEELSVDQT